MTTGTDRAVWIGGALLLLALRVEATDKRLPALPLPAHSQDGATNAIRLPHRELEVAVYPDAGRIGQIGFGPGNNLLRLDTNLLADAAQPADGWKNFGGDWLWPVMQSRWPALGGGNWPPPAVLEARPWQATAWVDVQGDSCCLLTNYYGPPVNLSASRLIRVDATEARVTIEQRLTRTAPSKIPATLWHISQVAGAEDAVMAGTNLTVLGFTPPPGELRSACASATVVRVANGTEHKLGSDAPDGWVAARRGEWLLVASARTEDEQGAWPDGGCRVEFYSNHGLGYTEIETLSDERALKPGESMSNTISLEVFHLPRALNGCDLADWIRGHGLRARTP